MVWQGRFYVPIVLSGLALPFLVGVLFVISGGVSRMVSPIPAGTVGGSRSLLLARGITTITIGISATTAMGLAGTTSTHPSG